MYVIPDDSAMRNTSDIDVSDNNIKKNKNASNKTYLTLSREISACV